MGISEQKEDQEKCGPPTKRIREPDEKDIDKTEAVNAFLTLTAKIYLPGT